MGSFCTHIGAQPQKANATLANPTNTRTTKLNRLALVLVAALFVASLLLSTASAEENSTATTSEHFHTAEGSTCYCCGSEYFSSCETCKNGATWSTAYNCEDCAGSAQCG